MHFTQANVLVTLVSGEEEAKRVMFGAGAAPCHTLLVNAARHGSIDEFLRLTKRLRASFERADQASTMESGRLRIGRANIGSGTTLGDLGGWNSLDAILMADSFDHFSDLFHELDNSSC